MAQLRATYDETLDALRRRFEQLEAAVARFPPDLDERALAAAWGSDDPSERNRADSVLASFEKTYMLLTNLIALSVKLGRRLGAVTAHDSSPEIDVLRDAGVISQDAQQALAAQREVRNTSQHVYVELSVSALCDAVRAQLHTTPLAVRAIGAWVSSFADESNDGDRNSQVHAGRRGTGER